jgi:hypothetical protein
VLVWIDFEPLRRIAPCFTDKFVRGQALSAFLSRVLNLSGFVANKVSGRHILHHPQEETGDEADGTVTGATEDEI